MPLLKQCEEKTLSGPIHLMKWNPRLDLMAIVLMSDEICLHRLAGWQKVWSLNLGPKSTLVNQAKSGKSKQPSDPKITCIEWRPDGKILAVAFNHNIMSRLDEVTNIPDDDSKVNTIALVEIESSEVIHVIQMDPEFKICCLNWISKCNYYFDGHKTGPPFKSSSHKDYFEMDAVDFLKPLNIPHKSSFVPKDYGPVPIRKLTEDSLSDLMKVKETDSLNILSVGTTDGRVMMYALGLMKIGTLKLETKNFKQIVSIGMSEDMTIMNVVHTTADNDPFHFRLSSFSMETLCENSTQFLAVAHVYARIMSLSRYLKETMSSILETWEDVLIEIDSKLGPYLKVTDAENSKKTEDGMDETEEANGSLLADEFMELLVFGEFPDGILN